MVSQRTVCLVLVFIVVVVVWVVVQEDGFFLLLLFFNGGGSKLFLCGCVTTSEAAVSVVGCWVNHCPGLWC